MATAFDQLASGWRRADMLRRIIYVNIGVFVAALLLQVVSWISGTNAGGWVAWLELPSWPQALMRQPWTLFTYMVTHTELFHIIFNMLWFYWMGFIFMEFFTSKQLLGLYLLGGLGGAVLFLLSYNLLPPLAGRLAMMLGASASVMAIAGAVAVYVPNYRVGLLLIGSVALKWVVLATVVIDLASISGDNNVGGHIAHLGGLAIGAWFALAIRRGTDITAWLNNGLDRLAGHAPRRRPSRRATNGPVVRSRNTGAQHSGGAPSEAQVDAVLDKIRRSGYASLTEAERQILFRASRNSQH